jgi:hypothetical protein
VFKNAGFIHGDRNTMRSFAEEGIDKNCSPVLIPCERNKIDIKDLK